MRTSTWLACLFVWVFGGLLATWALISLPDGMGRSVLFTQGPWLKLTGGRAIQTTLDQRFNVLVLGVDFDSILISELNGGKLLPVLPTRPPEEPPPGTLVRLANLDGGSDLQVNLRLRAASSLAIRSIGRQCITVRGCVFPVLAQVARSPATNFTFASFRQQDVVWWGLVASVVVFGFPIIALVPLLQFTSRVFIERRRAARAQCLRCGYSLLGTTVGNPCPECGNRPRLLAKP